MTRHSGAKPTGGQITALVPMAGTGRRSGAVLVLAVPIIIVLVAVATLSVDTGSLVYARARLQNVADAAALAAAQKVLEARSAGMEEEAARIAASAEAHAIAMANWDLARLEVVFGSYSDGSFTAHDTSTLSTAVRTTAFRDESAPGGQIALYFGPLLGEEAVNVCASAVASMNTGIKSMKHDLRPFSVPLPSVQEAEIGGTFTFVLSHNEWEPLGDDDYLAPGNFGFLDLSGGVPSANEMASWMLDGYPGELVIDPEVGFIDISGTTGVRSSLKDELTTLIGKPIFVCVHDQVTGAGTNANFRVVRFAGVTIQEVNLTGSPKYVRMQLDRLAFVPVGQGDTGGAMEDNLCRIQLVQ